MAGGEDEPVAVGPLRIRRVVVHHLRVEEVRERRERHRRARMPGVRLLDRVHRERPDGVDRTLLDVSYFATKLLVETAAAVPAPNDMPPPCPPADGTRRRAAPSPPRTPAVPARDRRAAQRRLLDRRGGDRAGERVRHQLDPVGVVRGARRRWRRPPRSRAAARRSPRSGRRRPRAPPGGCRRGVVSKVSPAIAPVASGSQPVERSPPRKGRNVSPCSSGSRSSTEPSAAASVFSSQAWRLPPSESAPPSRRGARRGGRGRGPAAAAAARSRRGSAARPTCRPSARPAGADAAGAEVRAGAVDPRPARSARRGRRSASMPSTSSSSASQRARRQVEQAGARRDRDARLVASPRRGSRRTRRSGRRARKTLRLASPRARRASPARTTDGGSAPVRACTASASSRRRSHSAASAAARVAPAEHRRQRPARRRRARAGCARSTTCRRARRRRAPSGRAATISSGSRPSYSPAAARRPASPCSSKRCARTEDEPTSSASTVATRRIYPGGAMAVVIASNLRKELAGLRALRRRLVQRRAARPRRALRAERRRQDDAAPHARRARPRSTAASSRSRRARASRCTTSARRSSAT